MLVYVLNFSEMARKRSVRSLSCSIALALNLFTAINSTTINICKSILQLNIGPRLKLIPKMFSTRK